MHYTTVGCPGACVEQVHHNTKTIFEQIPRLVIQNKLKDWLDRERLAVPQEKWETADNTSRNEIRVCPHNAKFPLVEIDVPVNQIWYVVIML
jgi:hypothetical protein